MDITKDVEICKERAIEWCNARKLMLTKIPKIGVSTEHAVMFLMETDSDMCFLEPMVTNPESDPKDISASITALWIEFQKMARRRGYRVIHAMTQIPAVKKRALNHGFHKSKMELFSKELY